LPTSSRALFENGTGSFPAGLFCAGPGNSKQRGQGSSPATPLRRTGHEALQFAVELWDQEENSLVAVLVLASRGGIAFAAYYEAIKECPEMTIVMRSNGRVVARSRLKPAI
jgi:hypothetical protein